MAESERNITRKPSEELENTCKGHLTWEEKIAAENIGNSFEAKLVFKKQQEFDVLSDSYIKREEISQLDQELINYAKIYDLIEERAINSIGFGTKLIEDTGEIFCKKRKWNLSFQMERLIYKTLGEEEFYELEISPQREEGLRKKAKKIAINNIIKGLSQEKKLDYDNELFKARLRLSMAINAEEGKHSAKSIAICKRAYGR